MIEILSTILSILLLAVVVSDCRTRRIPNALVAFVAFVAALRAVANGAVALPEFWLALTALFAACIALFAVGALGGGDAKLIPALALALPLARWPLFLAAMAASGGILALFVLARARWAARRTGVREGAPTLPYGVAIAIGGWSALWQTVAVALMPLLASVSFVASPTGWPV